MISTLPTEVNARCEALGGGPLRQASPVSGGDIAEAWRLTLHDGQRRFLKVHAAPPLGLFEAEAAGLAALAAVAGAPRTPRVDLVGPGFLLMEDLGAGRPTPEALAQLGEGLAALHHAVGPCFGFHIDNFCGLSPQHNPQMADGYAFFAEHRLLAQAQRARDAGRLSSTDTRRVDQLCHRLEGLIPPQPPSLIHGDLWSGNAHFTPIGAALIDPAVSWSWAEADLAMTMMFGAFDPRFYEAYLAHRPLEPGWRERAALYNLYHQLNHLNLFGGGYLDGARATLRRYGA
ncbi:fructosamine kinase family protein [Myxococcota bacterium]|nr:fructosamine kinase family protein [Myxococcota bacterium]